MSHTRIPGRATPEGTRTFHTRAATGPAGTPPVVAPAPGDLALSAVGLGTYLGDEDDEADALYREAAGHALAAGINVLDTASSYRSQRSERALGAALREEIGAGRLARSEVVVASKVGYLPFDGKRPRHLGPWVEEHFLRPGIFRRDELAGGVHCMAPRYIDHVLEGSRDNLGLEVIDIYYLHNPESGLDGVERAEWTRRLRSAFETLEHAVADGRIGCYGTATWNGYRKPPEAPEHLGLEELLGLAREVAGDGHHLRVLQLPLNLAMIEALTSPTQPSARAGGRRPLLEVARDHGLCVMSSASILQGQLTRGLGDDLRRSIDGGRTDGNAPAWSDAQRAIQFARSAPGLSTALVGMKHVEHVTQAAGVMRSAPLSPSAVADLLARFGD